MVLVWTIYSIDYKLPGSEKTCTRCWGWMSNRRKLSESYNSTRIYTKRGEDEGLVAGGSILKQVKGVTDVAVPSGFTRPHIPSFLAGMGYSILSSPS